MAAGADITSALSISDIWTSSLETIFIIGIYVMLFSILFGLVRETALSRFLPLQFLLSSLEITTGCQFLMGLTTIGSKIKVLLLILALEFGGICSLTQIAGVLDGCGLSLDTYLTSKLLCCIMAVGLYIIL